MQIHISPNDGVPIYLQIVNQVKYLVAAGRLAPGEELPPIRVLAERLLVNPNTVARAYRELEQEGVVEKRRTAGTYVSDRASPLRRNQRLRILAERLDALLAELAERHDRLAVAYADCGSGGAIDEVCERHGVARLPGLHCYDVLAGPRAQQLLAEEPGTYLLTDFLVRSFDALVWRGLGLDRHPELRDDYFHSYTRVIWLAQRRSPELLELAERAAAMLGLPLEVRDVGESGLEAQLERLAA